MRKMDENPSSFFCVFLKDRKEERWFGECQTSDYGGWGWKARGYGAWIRLRAVVEI